MKFLGKRAGDVLVEVLGPIPGRNYNMNGAATPPAPSVTVQVFGAGTVQVQQTQTSVFAGSLGSPNTHYYDSIPDDNTWADSGTPVAAASGPTDVSLTPGDYSAYRIVVVDPGDGSGKVLARSNWL